MKPAAYILYIILGFIFGLTTLIVGWVFDAVYGQDVDCIQSNFPCSEKEIPVFKRAIHNSVHQCEPDDETYNITGMCDPDDSDNGIEDDCGYNPCAKFDKISQCFATQELAKPYLDEYGNHSDVFIPCPPFSLPHQEELK